MAATKDKVLIDSPQLLSRRRRIADGLITGFMWVVYSYLWAPLISLVAWLLGFDFAYDVMVRAGGFETLKEIVSFYLTVVAMIFVVIAGWSMFNRRRYASRDRRHSIEPVSDADIAAFFGIQDNQLAGLRLSRISLLGVDDDGQIVDIEERIVRMDDESAPPVGPKGAVADNEAGNNNDEDESLVKASV